MTELKRAIHANVLKHRKGNTTGEREKMMRRLNEERKR